MQLGGIRPLTVESEGLWGALFKNEQIIISCYFTVSGWGIPPTYMQHVNKAFDKRAQLFLQNNFIQHVLSMFLCGWWVQSVS